MKTDEQSISYETKKYPGRNSLSGCLKQGYKDSNLEMTESESVALPFGDSPIYCLLRFALSTMDII